jgi:hypothetical protein
MSTKLTEDDWNSHQATIRSLYLIENRELLGPGGVMQEMMTKYGFSATYDAPLQVSASTTTG